MKEENTDGTKKGNNILVIAMLVGAVAAVCVSIYIATRPVDVDSGINPQNVLTGDQRVTSDADRLIRAGRYMDAVNLLERYLQKNSDSEQPRVMLADTYFRLIRSNADQYSKAVQLRDEYKKKYPKNAMGRLKKDHPDSSRCLRQWERCEEQIELVLQNNPKQPEILWLKGEYLEMKSLGDGIGFFRRSAEQPDAGPVIWGMYGQFMLQESNFKEARKYLEKAREAGSKSGNVYYALGRVALGESRLKDAVKYLQFAVDAVPSKGEAWYFLGMVQRELERIDEAITSLNRAVKTTSGVYRGFALKQLGECYIGKAKWVQAASTFVQAADYPPDQWRSFLQAAQCFYFSDKPGGHELGKAMDCIDKAYAQSGGDPKVATWKKKIEDARYGPIDAKNEKDEKKSGSILDFSPKLK